MFFKDVIGQEELKKQLTETARKGFIPHARLFCGADGNGGFQLALAYARYLNCTGRGETESCGTCPSCLKYNELAHPDLHFVFPMVSNKSAKKEVCDDYLPEWRGFLKDQIARRTYFNIDTWLIRMGAENKQAVIYAAESDKIIHKMNLRIYEADYRILFVWMPERMNTACANKLLKIIEEPPANTAILMVTDNPDRVLGTIVSRSQTIQIRPIYSGILTRTLVDIWDLHEDDATQVAYLSGGNYLKATELLTVENDNVYFLEQFKTIMRNGWTRNVVAMKSFSEEMASLGRERQKNFLAFCQRQVRENFIKCLNEPSLNYMNKEEADFARNFSPYVNERNVMDLMDELSLAERHIAQNVNSKMVFFDLSMRIIVLIKR
ncbi:MAG: DNA polymerase III subunit delta [Tannerella sp.]|jgi:DNA polymerase-3 subunit delta'|nr:DNA polymerase III subunit delta [Tannerella sp.]